MKIKQNTKLQIDCIENLFNSYEIPKYDIAQNFPVFTNRRNLARFISHYEAFKDIIELPGSIIDLGVYKGASTFTWAKLCEIFCQTDILKKVYAFDTFEGFPSISIEDGTQNTDNDLIKGGYFSGNQMKDILEIAQDAMMFDKQIRDIKRIEFIKGNVCETIPEFILKKGNGLKVCLLNLDLDLYLPTKVALEFFVPKMVKGGIIILDEYAHETFGGETKAVDEYFIEIFGHLPKIQKFSWHSNPSGFIKID